MFQYCPACGKKGIVLKGNRFSCPVCGFVYYHNTAAATGCLICVPDTDGPDQKSGEKFVFLVRGNDPGRGMLDLPGGFVDPGEGVLEGLYRELQEEIGWTPPVPEGTPLTEIFTLFASFPNVYTYKNIPYNTCDMYFSLCAPGLREQDLSLREGEIAAVRFLRPEEINYDEFAFDSTRRAVQAYLLLD